MISIIIVNWNGDKVLDGLLQSLSNIKEIDSGYIEVIVVDNNSTDRSKEILKNYSNFIIAQSSVNLGFAGGCNLGALLSKNPYLLFLNPDTLLKDDIFPNILKLINDINYSKIGIFGIQLINEDGDIARSCARFPRAGMFVAQNIGLDRIFPEFGHTMKEWDHMSSRLVDQVIGAFYLVKRELFFELDGFDERFFVYFEEVDFAYRAKQLGYATYYLSDLQAIHSGEGTTSQIKSTRLFYLLRSRLLYGKKHFGNLENLLNFTNTLFLEPLARAAFLAASGRINELPELKKGFQKLYADLPNILKETMKS